MNFESHVNSENNNDYSNILIEYNFLFPANRMTIEYLPEKIGSSSLEEVCGEGCA